MAVLQGNGPSSQVTYELVPDRMTIGRKPENDIAIEWDKAVSRRHAELELVAGSWFVSDLDSANGTFVNGSKVDRKRALHSGDELRVGDTTLRMGGIISSEPLSDTAQSTKPPELTRKQSEVLRERRLPGNMRRVQRTLLCSLPCADSWLRRLAHCDGSAARTRAIRLSDSRRSTER